MMVRRAGGAAGRSRVRDVFRAVSARVCFGLLVLLAPGCGSEGIPPEETKAYEKAAYGLAADVDAYLRAYPNGYYRECVSGLKQLFQLEAQGNDAERRRDIAGLERIQATLTEARRKFQQSVNRPPSHEALRKAEDELLDRARSLAEQVGNMLRGLREHEASLLQGLLDALTGSESREEAIGRVKGALHDYRTAFRERAESRGVAGALSAVDALVDLGRKGDRKALRAFLVSKRAPSDSVMGWAVRRMWIDQVLAEAGVGRNLKAPWFDPSEAHAPNGKVASELPALLPKPLGIVLEGAPSRGLGLSQAAMEELLGGKVAAPESAPTWLVRIWEEVAQGAYRLRRGSATHGHATEVRVAYYFVLHDPPRILGRYLIKTSPPDSRSVTVWDEDLGGSWDTIATDPAPIERALLEQVAKLLR